MNGKSIYDGLFLRLIVLISYKVKSTNKSKNVK